MFPLADLLKIQDEFAKSLKHKPTLDQYVFALNIEIAELLNTLPWKWWKKNHVTDKTKALDELADVLAFWFSAYNFILKRIPKAEADFNMGRELDVIQFNIEYGIAKEMNVQGMPKAEYITYETTHTIVNIRTAGRRLGRIIGTVMRHTGTSILEITAAYKNKMEENHSRQHTNY